MFAPVRVISESDEEGSNFDKLKRVETSRSAAVKYGGERRRGRRGADGLHMLRVPMMPIDVEPPSTPGFYVRSPTRNLSPAFTKARTGLFGSHGNELHQRASDMTDVRSNSISTMGSRFSDGRHTIPISRSRLELAGYDLDELNKPGEGKVPVFFVGGSVTVRGWATGSEGLHAVKYLCLKAFGSFDEELEEELIFGEVNPQFLQWPSAQEFESRIGATTALEDKPLRAGTILEIRNLSWLEGIRSGRQRAMVEAQLAPMTRWQKLMRRLHLLLNEPSSSRAAGIIAYFVITAIMLSTVTLCLETMPSYYQSVSSALSTWFFLEAACISIFTLELSLRFVSAPGKWEFVTNGMNIIDLVAIFPFYLEVIAQGTNIPGLSIFRVTRLARVLRLFKVSQGPVYILSQTMKESLRPMYSLMLVVAIAAVTFAAFMYYAERGSYNIVTGNWERPYGWRCPIACTESIVNSSRAEPELKAIYHGCRDGATPYVMVDYTEIRPSIQWTPPGLVEGMACKQLMQPSPFDSIPACTWWSVVTMTTLGYGDMVPISMTGKTICMFTMLSGILVIALPVTVIGQNFSTIYAKDLEEKKRAADAKKRRKELQNRESRALLAGDYGAKMDEYAARTFRMASACSKFRNKSSSTAKPRTDTSPSAQPAR